MKYIGLGSDLGGGGGSVIVRVGLRRRDRQPDQLIAINALTTKYNLMLFLVVCFSILCRHSIYVMVTCLMSRKRVMDGQFVNIP